MRKIQAKLGELTAAIDAQRAAQNILRFPEEFFDQRHVDNAVSAIEGKPLWPA